MRIVLDNNVFVSGIFWKGASHEIIKLAEGNKVEIYSSIEILKELFGVLRRDKFKPYFKEAETTIEAVFQKILKLVQICVPTIKVRVVKEDPPDNRFLACALTARAFFVVSGDKHLLQLKEFQGIPIVSPREFLKRFKSIKK